MAGMDNIYPPIVNLIARGIYCLAILLYGGLAGGLAGFLAMSFVVGFLLFGASAVIAESVVCSIWAAIKWFVYFLVFHFVLYVIDEPLSDEMLVFLAGTLGGLERWARGISDAELVGFFFGIMLVGGAVWLLGVGRSG